MQVYLDTLADLQDRLPSFPSEIAFTGQSLQQLNPHEPLCLSPDARRGSAGVANGCGCGGGREGRGAQLLLAPRWMWVRTAEVASSACCCLCP